MALQDLSSRSGSSRTVICGALVFLLLPLLSGCGKALPAQSEYVLGTVCTVNLYNGGTARIYGEIFARLREIEDRMSTTLPDSDVTIINQNAGIQPVAVHEDVIEVLEAALGYAELSGGAFDPTVGPLVNLWGIGQGGTRVPAEDEIRRALSLVNWRDVVIDPQAGTVFLQKTGMGIDLGAIAKGYAADEAVRIVKKNRVSGAIIDLGGNIFAYGEKEGKQPWRIGVQSPLADRGEYFGILELRNKTIVTSGVYERYLEIDGRRYHHILSTINGRPVETGLLSVTIITSRSMEADGLSTSVFALGYEKGAALIESIDGAAAIFVFEDMSVRGTRNALESFTLSDPAFRLEG
jgi:thiamine biosynthesis lipoprotein